jgi:hypothetical protein
MLHGASTVVQEGIYGPVEAVDMTEVFTVEMLGRQTATAAMVLGEHMLIGVTVATAGG